MVRHWLGLDRLERQATHRLGAQQALVLRHQVTHQQCRLLAPDQRLDLDPRLDQ